MAGDGGSAILRPKSDGPAKISVRRWVAPQSSKVQPTIPAVVLEALLAWPVVV